VGTRPGGVTGACGKGTLRGRLGLTQVQFGKLLGVSGPAVTHWAGKEGRIRMRPHATAALLSLY